MGIEITATVVHLKVSQKKDNVMKLCELGKLPISILKYLLTHKSWYRIVTLTIYDAYLSNLMKGKSTWLQTNSRYVTFYKRKAFMG